MLIYKKKNPTFVRIIEKKIFLETIWPAKINGIEHNIGNKFGDNLKISVSDEKIRIIE